MLHKNNIETSLLATLLQLHNYSLWTFDVHGTEIRCTEVNDLFQVALNLPEVVE